ESPYLCASHFLPTDIIHHSSHVDLRPDAMPIFLDLSTGEEDAPSSAFDVSNEVKGVPVEMKGEPMDNFVDIKTEGLEDLESIKSFLCSECGKKLNNKHTFVLHMRTHPGAEVYMCSQCDIFFHTIFNLGWHVRVQHKEIIRINSMEIYTDKKTLKCPLCDEYSSTSAGAWNCHIRLKHATTASEAGYALHCECGKESSDMRK
ncbi:hypothetical protein PMAYCL1PPCAC_08329, partial [Pristionchus mayeri]